MEAIPRYLLPDNARVDSDGQLEIGGLRVTDIAQEGTPQFIYDRAHLVARCREAKTAFPGGVAYASKAFLCRAIAEIVDEEGLRIDVASGGELHVALNSDIDPENIVFHGNNKNDAELTSAIQLNVGLIVIDSFDEIDRIERIATEFAHPHPVRCLVRVNPGIEAHTHEYVMTGQDDSKFGLSLVAGHAQAAIDRMRKSRVFDLVGVHAHIGSQIFETEPFEKTVAHLAEFVTRNDLRELCVGGGLGVPYVTGEAAPTITQWGAAVHAAMAAASLPSEVAVTAEPGRSIVAGAAITVYTVGTIKEVPGVRTFLSVDGGMSDNPRPVLYGSGYEAFLPRSPFVERPRQVTIVGKHCESGDFLVKEAFIPADTAVGDIIATPVTGAYGYSMGSNYNRLPRPPVVFVEDGMVKTVIRRETYDDLMRLDT